MKQGFWGLQAWRRGAPLVILLALRIVVLPQGVRAGSEEDGIRTKLQQLEERLKQLEQQSATASSKGSAEAGQTKSPAIEELRQQLDILAAEVEKLRSGERLVEVTSEQVRSMGLAPSAAATYRKERGVSIAGYGQMLYENFKGANERGEPSSEGSQLDFLRAILYAGYRFNDKFVFNSEIEVEHTDEVSLEFAYVDYLANPHLTLRGGLLLMPMGLINEYHEPNVFLGNSRPETERRIIPSTWSEGGFGVLGSAGKFNYRAYVVNGLNATGFSSDGLRAGRQGGGEAKATNLALVGRLDVAPTPGVFFGGSVFTGNSGQGQFVVDGSKLGVRTTIGEVHAQAQIRGFDFRGLYARASLDDVADLNTALNLTGSDSIGKTQQGGYLQFGYNVLSQSSEKMLTPFYRFEKLNTQHEVPVGFSADPTRHQTFHTFGFEFKPIHNIVVKTDYQWTRNSAKTGLNQFNIGLGYAF
jgi:hypothetical protein